MGQTRPMRHPFALALLVASLLVAGACSDDDDGGDAADASTSTTAEETATTCEADDADATELEALLADTVPDGFEQQADDVGDTGPSDLAKAVRDDGMEDASQALTELGFRRGYQRLWMNEADEQLIAFLYEFCDEEGASAAAQRTADLLVATGGFEPLETSVDGASGFVQEGSQGTVVTVTAPSGAYAVQAVAFSPTATATVEELTARAEALLDGQLAQLDSA